MRNGCPRWEGDHQKKSVAASLLHCHQPDGESLAGLGIDVLDVLDVVDVFRFRYLCGQPGPSTPSRRGSGLSSLTTRPDGRPWQVMSSSLTCPAVSCHPYSSFAPHGSLLPPLFPAVGRCESPPLSRSPLRLPIRPSPCWFGQTELDGTANCHLPSQMECPVSWELFPSDDSSLLTLLSRNFKTRLVTQIKHILRTSSLVVICTKVPQLYCVRHVEVIFRRSSKLCRISTENTQQLKWWQIK